MITIVIGALGSSKTSYVTWKAIEALDSGKAVFANYKINYLSKEGLKASRIDVGRFVESMKKRNKVYPEHSALIILDEAYLYLESRNANSKMNSLMNNFIAQSRKYGFDVYIVSQLGSSIDKRERHLADCWIVCVKMQYTDEDGIEKTYFKYTHLDNPMDVENASIWESVISAEDMKEKVWKYFDTQEIAKHSKLSEKEAEAVNKMDAIQISNDFTDAQV